MVGRHDAVFDDVLSGLDDQAPDGTAAGDRVPIGVGRGAGDGAEGQGVDPGHPECGGHRRGA